MPFNTDSADAELLMLLMHWWAK